MFRDLGRVCGSGFWEGLGFKPLNPKPPEPQVGPRAASKQAGETEREREIES